MLNYSFTYGDLEFFLLILVRIASFIYAAPFFNQRSIPQRVKIGLAIFIAILLYGVVDKTNPIVYNSVVGYAAIVIKEIVTGLIIGFGTNLCLTIVNFAGHIVDMQVGISMVTLMDPSSNEQVGITGIYYQYTVTLMLLVSGMYEYLIKALADTFELIPVNGAVFNTESLLSSFVAFLGNYMVVGFRICLPVLIVTITLNCVLGILAKVAPQMNMFSVGMQIKILVGFSIMFLSTGMLPSVANFVFTNTKVMLNAFVGGLM